MFRKLFLAYLALVVTALAVLGVLAAGSTRTRMLEEIAARLENQAETVKPLVALPRESLQSALQDIGRSLETRVTVIDAQGAVLGDSDANPASMDNHAGRPEVLEARAGGRGLHVRHSDTVRHDMMYLAIPLDPARRDGIVIRSALPLTQVHAEMAGLYASIAVAFAVIALAGAGGTYVLARFLTRPLDRIRETAQAVASGDFTKRAPLGGTDEIGSVGAALNRMADELASRLDRLKEESSKLEALVAGMQEGVVALDETGRIGRLNAAACSLLGLREDSAGLVFWEALRLPGLEEAVRKVLRDRVPMRAPFEIGSRVVLLGGQAIRGQGGAVLVTHDITEEKRYDDLRKEFVANVSHELRTPITIVRGYVETLLEGALREPGKPEEFLKIIDQNVRRLGALLEDLLELSKLDAGGPQLKPEEVDLPGLLDGVCARFRPLAERRRQSLVLEAASAVPGWMADPALLERAVSNLVDNAVKYTPEGGSVRVRSESDGDSVTVTVEDTGIGISEKDLPRVFERFYRVDKSRSRDMGGTGLGLAIVKHIAQLHGGGVEVRSRTGQGSAFTLRLPRGGAPR